MEPKDEKLNFEDFKTYALTTFSDANEDIMKAAFDKVSNNGETITFEEYKKALDLLKDPDFKLYIEKFVNSELAMLLDWKAETSKIWLLATDEDLVTIFDQFKVDNDKISFENFTKAIKIVREK